MVVWGGSPRKGCSSSTAYHSGTIPVRTLTAVLGRAFPPWWEHRLLVLSPGWSMWSLSRVRLHASLPLPLVVMLPCNTVRETHCVVRQSAPTRGADPGSCGNLPCKQHLQFTVGKPLNEVACKLP